jgi:hypothetical protein
MVVTMEQAARDPRQGKLNLVVKEKIGPGIATGTTAITAVDREVGMQGA